MSFLFKEENKTVSSIALVQPRMLIAPQLSTIGVSAFRNSRLEKVVGDKIMKIDDHAFNSSEFLTQINLENVKTIGKDAFSKTMLKRIKNNIIKKLSDFEFNEQGSVIQSV